MQERALCVSVHARAVLRACVSRARACVLECFSLTDALKVTTSARSSFREIP